MVQDLEKSLNFVVSIEILDKWYKTWKKGRSQTFRFLRRETNNVVSSKLLK